MAPARLCLTRLQWETATAHLETCLPEEGCGLLAGRADQVALVLPIENVEHSVVHYHMEHRALVSALTRLEDGGLELLGAFHSHPNGPSGVSLSDVREWQYFEAALVVFAPGNEGWEARAFLSDGRATKEIPFLIGIG